jgi:hypothetical protein
MVNQWIAIIGQIRGVKVLYDLVRLGGSLIVGRVNSRPYDEGEGGESGCYQDN